MKFRNQWWAYCKSIDSINKAPTYAEWLESQLTAANARVEELEEGVKNALRPHLGGNPYCISSADLDALVALLEQEKGDE